MNERRNLGTKIKKMEKLRHSIIHYKALQSLRLAWQQLKAEHCNIMITTFNVCLHGEKCRQSRQF